MLQSKKFFDIFLAINLPMIGAKAEICYDLFTITSFYCIVVNQFYEI